MFVFQFKPLIEDEKKVLKNSVPKPILNFEKIRKQVDAKVPDSVIREIVKLGVPAKIDEINNAASTLSRRHSPDFLVYIFRSLDNNQTIDIAFVNEPNRIIDMFDKISSLGFNLPYLEYSALESLKDPIMANAFVNNIAGMMNSFWQLAKFARDIGSSQTFLLDFFNMLEKHSGLTRIFVNNPNRLFEGFEEVANYAKFEEMRRFGKGATEFLFQQISRKSSLAVAFEDYLGNRRTINQLISPLIASSNAWIVEWGVEVGRPLDDLHEDETKRKKYLDGLSTERVLGLLLSNPAYFYTSSNHMLIDRLKKDLNGKSITAVFEEYKIDDELIRNFLFRAINYDRFYGRENCLFTKRDIGKLLPLFLKPLDNEEFDPKYYFLLANGIESIRNFPLLMTQLSQKLEKRYKELEKEPVSGAVDENRKQIRIAIEYILFKINPSTKLVTKEHVAAIEKLGKKNYYDSVFYTNNRKLTIVQVFDKKDTEKEHWKLSQRWFAKYGKPKQGKDGELIYETPTARIVLFMGEDQKQNQVFIRQQLKKTPNLVLTFRGHSFSLVKNFPLDIFGNQQNHILFIPGSCGSAGSTPGYISKNPNTDIRFFSNTSTGRGQVTNSIIDALIATHKQTRFLVILQKSKSNIEGNGGDISSIKVWSSGEELLAYVNQQALP